VGRTGGALEGLAGWLIAALPGAFLAVFFAFPLLEILSVSFTGEQGPDLSGFVRLVGSAYYRETAAFTLGQALLSTVLTLGAALPCAYVFSTYVFPGRRLLLALASLPFVLPTLVVALAFQALLGRGGVVNDVLQALLNLERPPLRLDQTLTIILIAHVFYNFALVLRMITAFWSAQSVRLEEAARTLGVSGWQLWWRVRLPVLRPVLWASFLLVFIYTFTSFGVVLVLGGVRFATIEVQIYYQTTAVFNLPMAAALCVFQMAVVGLLTALYVRYERQIQAVSGSLGRASRSPHSMSERIVVGAAALAVGLFLCVPLLALVWLSLTYAQDSPSLAPYAALLRGETRLPYHPLVAAANSLGFAVLTLVLSLGLGVAVVAVIVRRPGWGRWLNVAYMLPLGVSAVTLGLGMLLAFDEPPVNWRGAAWLVPVAHTLVALPLVVRMLLPAARAVPQPLLDASYTLGVGRLSTARRVVLPLVRRSALAAAVFAFNISVGEFGASAFLARPETPTLTSAIFRLLGQPRPEVFGQALALSVVLLLICLAGFAVLEWLADDKTPRW
jgi:thiamine transport system permease protein